eukprot:10956924-Heterocapsa_arctica.AAC.1
MIAAAPTRQDREGSVRSHDPRALAVARLREAGGAATVLAKVHGGAPRCHGAGARVASTGGETLRGTAPKGL